MNIDLAASYTSRLNFIGFSRMGRKPKPTPPIEPPAGPDSITSALGDFILVDFTSSDFVCVFGDFMAINFTSDEFLVD